MLHNLKLTSRPFQYAINQRGEFYHLKDNPGAWYQAYTDELQKTMSQIRTWTDARPLTVLDIGCGLGCIDAVLMLDGETKCYLIDGDDGTGTPDKHDKPFCSRAVVSEFMDDNGVPDNRWSYHSPDNLEDADFPVFDLVLSTRSWCFHYAPEWYMWFVQKHVVPGTRILVDVRRNKSYRTRLAATWKDSYVLEQHEKFERMVFIVGGRKQ